MELEQLKKIVEGALLASNTPLTVSQLDGLFDEGERPGPSLIKQALASLDIDFKDRAIELSEVGSGYRIQVRTSLMPYVAKLWEDKPPRYSRALLETLAIIAYRQPITRGDIEQIRGVSISSTILRTLQERDWIKVIGHRDVPGRPELLGTTKAFLDYFNIKALSELPTLAEIKDLEDLEPELDLNDPEHSTTIGDTLSHSGPGEPEVSHDSEDVETTQPADEHAETLATDQVEDVDATRH